MGFSFGYVTEIDSEVALGSFIMMIAFLVGFDHLTGVLEWSLQGVPIYNHMLQHIYKEIMIMGVVSFCIGMYNTTDEAHRQANQEWIIGIDFAHYILFYMAFFFVLHAFYLIFLAMETAKQFDKFHSMTIANVRALVPPDYSWFNELIFNYSPVSKVRDSFEFKIVHVLFRDTYKWVALDFNFSSYLSGCMQHYALKVMSAGSSSWLVILVLIVLNYARIKLGGDGYLNCGPDKYDQSVIYINATDDDHHRMLIQKEADMFSGYSEDEEEHLNRILAGGAAEVQSVSTQCSIRVLRAFFMCGVMLCCLTILFLAVSRIYMSRLIHRTGCDSPADYFNFLSLEEETLNEELMENRRRTASIGDGDTPSMDNGTSTFRLAEIKQQRLSGTNAARKGGGRRMSIGSAARSINELKKKTVSEEVEMYMKISNGFVSCRRGMRRGIDCIIDWFHACWMYIFHREAYNRMVEKVNALKGPEKLSLSLKGGPVLRMLKSPDSMNGVSPEPSIAEMQQQVEPKSPRKSMFKPRVTVFPLVSDQQSTSTINKVFHSLPKFIHI